MLHYNMFGDKMNNFFNYADSDIRMHYKCDTHPDPKKFKMHSHDFYELYVFFGGKGVFKIEGNRYTPENGDILIMRSSESHYIEIAPDFPYTRLSVHFNPKIFSEIDKNNSLLVPFTNRKSGTLNLYRESDFNTNSYQTFIENIITDTSDKRLQTLSNLLPLLREISMAFSLKSDEINNDSLDCRIIRYINHNLSNEITLNALCEKFFISRPHLCRIFKNATGSTVGNYITTKRTALAKELITQGVPPTKVYIQCGFNDYSTFYRAYLKNYGASPNSSIEKN